MQHCDSYERAKCEQLCIKSGNGTEATCHCHKGFRLIGTQCFGKLKFLSLLLSLSVCFIIDIYVCSKYYFSSSFPALSNRTFTFGCQQQISMNARNFPIFVDRTGNVLI
jgi:hypothetical protein